MEWLKNLSKAIDYIKQNLDMDISRQRHSIIYFKAYMTLILTWQNPKDVNFVQISSY
ncbi:hypothetical protein CBOS2020_37150 (plasmid) [Clostridium botulinum]|nr:hypothetical protein CBOS2020_37150 [Clostridium botulinum]